MIDLKDPQWANLSHAYGSAKDTPSLLRDLRKFPKVIDYKTEPYFTLWSSLCHQGDIYSASIAALPHLVEACEDSLKTAHWSAAQLALCIEMSRLEGRCSTQFDIPNEYHNAFKRLPTVISKMQAENPNDNNVPIGAAALAISSKNVILAKAYLEFDSTDAEKFLNSLFDD